MLRSYKEILFCEIKSKRIHKIIGRILLRNYKLKLETFEGVHKTIQMIRKVFSIIYHIFFPHWKNSFNLKLGTFGGVHKTIQMIRRVYSFLIRRILLI